MEVEVEVEEEEEEEVLEEEPPIFEWHLLTVKGCFWFQFALFGMAGLHACYWDCAVGLCCLKPRLDGLLPYKDCYAELIFQSCFRYSSCQSQRLQL